MLRSGNAENPLIPALRLRKLFASNDLRFVL